MAKFICTIDRKDPILRESNDTIYIQLYAAIKITDTLFCIN